VNRGGVYEMACLISRSLVAEREEKGVQEREEIGAAFIGMEVRRIRQDIDQIDGERIGELLGKK
jgi:hypothetical protein